MAFFLRWAAPAWVALLAACSRPDAAGSPRDKDRFHDLLVDPSLCAKPAAVTVTREQALRDAAVLERIVREGYAGFDELARRGVDWDAMFPSLRSAALVASEPIDVERLRQRWLEALAALADGHLALSAIGPDGRVRRGDTGRPRGAYTADLELSLDERPRVLQSSAAAVSPGMALVACDGVTLRDLLRPALAGPDAQPVARLVVRAERDPAPLSCRFETAVGTMTAPIALRRLRAPRPEARAPAFALTGGEAPRLRLRSFDPSQRTDLEAFVASAPSLRSKLAVLVDVRGNGGGADPFYMDFFRGLVALDLVRPAILHLRSEITLQGDLVFADCQLAAPIDPAAREDLRQRRQRASEELERGAASPAGIERWAPRRITVHGGAEEPFGGALVVLTDAKCASACEGFVQMTRQVPRALVVGSSTAGVATFGEVRPYRLPETGIWIHVASMLLSMPDAFREGYGFEPDLWIDDDDPAAVAAAMATCFARGGECRAAIEKAAAWRAR